MCRVPPLLRPWVFVEGLIRDRTGEGQVEGPALGLIVQLSDRLRAAGVIYCHFKSNEGLPLSLSGENDLDLLISRRDAQEFASVLTDLGFRVARPDHDRVVPGVLDYYGLDPETASVVHVHAHYQLRVGDDTTKNYHLNIEDAYLKSVDNEGVLPVPDASFEFILLVLRMVLKHFPFDAQLARKGKLTPTERRELEYLEERIDPAQVRQIVTEHLEVLSPRLFDEATRAVRGEFNRWQRALVARRLVRSLGHCGRRVPLADIAVKVWRRVKWRITSKLRGKRKKRSDHGGLLVAIIGGDGSGKSSAVEMLRGFLGRHFDAQVVHMGKPPRSLLTRVIKFPMARARNRGLLASTRLSPIEDLSEVPFPGYGFLLWHLLNARDRHRAYLRARRASLSGTLVVTDRLPLPSLSRMDSPRTLSVRGTNGKPLARWMVARERAYYREIGYPDLLIVLRVSPEVAVGRRADQDPDFVRLRAQEVWDRNWGIPNCVVIDADRPVDEVQEDVRQAVWSML